MESSAVDPFNEAVVSCFALEPPHHANMLVKDTMAVPGNFLNQILLRLAVQAGHKVSFHAHLIKHTHATHTRRYARPHTHTHTHTHTDTHTHAHTRMQTYANMPIYGLHAGAPCACGAIL